MLRGRFRLSMPESAVLARPGGRVVAAIDRFPDNRLGEMEPAHPADSHVFLDFPLQNTPDLKAGEGLPAFFNDYVADGERVEHAEPARGETVLPAS